jgi:hypothetical protein
MARPVFRWCVLSIAVVALSFCARPAYAVPSFARQTGLPCSVCHTTFPELTPFGREFKLNGYTMAGMKQIELPSGERVTPLRVNETFPLSVMFQTSLTRTDKRQPGTQNNNVEFPQQLSLFLAGEISPHIGTFLQATYNGQDDHFTMDNTSIRYADRTTLGGSDTIYGVTLNNNPTLEDPWHSTPAFGFPFASADSAPTPAAAALVDGSLAQQVAGLGVYSFWNQMLYGDVTLYRTAHIGSPQPPTGEAGNNIGEVAPYWRFALQERLAADYVEVGTFGLFARLHPKSVSGDTDQFTDIAADSQYEHPIGSDLITAHATYIHESQHLDATHAAGGSVHSTEDLHTFRLDAIYHFGNLATFALGYFRLHGRKDTGLFAPAPITGSANGKPDSDGLIAEAAYYPWQNVRLSAQYKPYFEFNGRHTNYDGSGRDASDNNTLYLLAWLVW